MVSRAPGSHRHRPASPAPAVPSTGRGFGECAQTVAVSSAAGRKRAFDSPSVASDMRSDLGHSFERLKVLDNFEPPTASPLQAIAASGISGSGPIQLFYLKDDTAEGGYRWVDNSEWKDGKYKAVPWSTVRKWGGLFYSLYEEKTPEPKNVESTRRSASADVSVTPSTRPKLPSSSITGSSITPPAPKPRPKLQCSPTEFTEILKDASRFKGRKLGVVLEELQADYDFSRITNFKDRLNGAWRGFNPRSGASMEEETVTEASSAHVASVTTTIRVDGGNTVPNRQLTPSEQQRVNDFLALDGARLSEGQSESSFFTRGDNFEQVQNGWSVRISQGNRIEFSRTHDETANTITYSIFSIGTATYAH